MASTITPRIVNLTAKVIAAPTPSTLQQSGAAISVGGTTLTAGTYQFLGSAADLTSILSATGNYTELQHMVDTHFAQGSSVGIYVLELGVQVTVDDGIAALATWIIANPNIFYSYLTPADWDTMPAPAAPSLSSTSGGTLAAATYYVKIAYVNAAGAVGQTSAEASLSVLADNLLNVASPAALSGATGYNVYVSTTTGTETLQNVSPIAIGTAWTEPTSGLVTGAVPDTTLATLANDYASPTAKTYFFITTTSINIPAYFATTSKAAYCFVPSPTAVASEFGAAAHMYNWLVNNPGPANVLAPMAYRYLYGVTAWPTQGYSSQINTILTNYGNINYPGSEGGISNVAIFKGTTNDGTQASWWYGVDWVQIQMNQAIAADVLNGSNRQPPLLYRQAGINELQKVAQLWGDDAVSYGCALSAQVTAVDFATYTAENPNDYKAGIYSGLLCNLVGQNGFLTINFTLNAYQFVA